jgi:uncharacterized protein DUF1670
MEQTGSERRAFAKTKASQLQHKLETEFDLAPRMAQAVVAEAEACLSDECASQVSGQRWVLLASREAGHGQALSETATKRVCWTVDAGADDAVTLAAQGRIGVRRVRIQRLLDEAVEQGALATQEDLAQVLAVEVRTIKRDCQALQAAGVWLPLRGNVRSIGRGQSHKRQIVGRWLRGETYDQLMRSTHHHVSCIARYVQTFVRVVALHQEGLPAPQIAHLTQCGERLVQEYLQLYQQPTEPVCQERLAEHLQRLQSGRTPAETQKKRLP